MRNYELMFVVRPTLEEEATMKVLATVKELLEKEKAVISKKKLLKT